MGEFRRYTIGMVGSVVFAVLVLKLSGFGAERSVSMVDMVGVIPAWVAGPLIGAVAVGWYLDA